MASDVRVTLKVKFESDVRYRLPGKLPGGWKLLNVSADGGAWIRHDGLKVIATAATEEDFVVWIHVSCSRKSRLPSWVDLTAVKHLFIGDDRRAIQVLPEKANWINIHPYCLHLFAPMYPGLDPIPDFTRGGKSI